MTNEELEAYFRSLGWQVEELAAPNGARFLTVRDYVIPSGSMAGRTVDVAIERSSAVPYVVPPAVHIRPALVPMGNYNTQQSPLGSDWQYWSRVLRGHPTPQRIVTHIATILSEV